ncbi:TPA: hypothetical protein DCR49_10780 [Candidatus Delongbacteria bacterium]|nr:MAG: hypothetical protein A2Y39_03130 [Candidatus Delongbacteria bacterium GWF2_40_14]HAQ62463.1 hypothetical protein [Candidatus Delongbacteria bacterium]
MQKIKEKYHKITDDHSEFDLVYWQAQGSKAIFKAAEGMIKDYFLIRGINVNESRLQRTVEAFRKA